MPDFFLAQWTPEQIEVAATAALAHKRAGLDVVFAIPDDQRTFANTIGALADADASLADLQQQLELLLSVHPDAAVRDASQHATDRIEAAQVDMEYDRRLWSAVQAWAAKPESLEPADQKLADDTLRDMRRMGFALPDAQFEELKRVVTELKQLETAFEKAINDWHDHIEVTREQLAGLPERYIEGLTRSDDKYLVTLQYPDLFPFMRLADDDAARRELASKNLQKGGPENLERLAQLIRLRQRHAQLLGYATHADFQCEPRMAKTAGAVQSFLDDIAAKLMPMARKELAELAAQKGGPIGFHEQAYWGYKFLKERYDVDGELVKEYLPLAHVLDGMMRIYQEVLGVTFAPVADVPLWHPDAKLYEMRDGDRVLGHFILDLHPREGKFGHAAAFPIRMGRQPQIALVCNFPKPTPANPSLLTQGEVETLFHEFGHVMHTLCSGGKWQQQNGLDTALDFVEMPSQLFEEWPWVPEVMRRISTHYKTGEPMPEELQQKLIASRRALNARYYLNQATKALYDLRMHMQPVTGAVEPAQLAQWYREMASHYEGITLPDDAMFAAGWGHMGNYDAGYYSYLWSKVYALDIYTRFADAPLDPAVGREYRAKVLSPGASRPELTLVTDFLGRAPSNAAFLKSLGIDTMK
jgi:thimet oligopeptidase